ncbi:MAG: ADP/ATP-dependent (S)-NAD(P)H-hydrate dehydratase [Patescibacteria group bacterium]
MPRVFDPKELQKLKKRSELPENGEITIIGGSDLFHGAPILSLRAASRVVDMVYFSSPEPSLSEVALHLKSQLSSFIWVPWEEAENYIKKSDAILIGPGMKRYHKEAENSKYEIRNPKVEEGETFDEAGTQTKFIVEKLIRQFPDKRWVVDGGALQTIDSRWIPQGAIVTPNTKEYHLLFNAKLQITNDKWGEGTERLVQEEAAKHNCIIVLKGRFTYVGSKDGCVEVRGGNSGLTKGGTGDTLAGLTVALAAQNEPVLAAASASWLVKKAGDELYQEMGTVYNADDLAGKVAETLGKFLR